MEVQRPSVDHTAPSWVLTQKLRRHAQLLNLSASSGSSSSDDRVHPEMTFHDTLRRSYGFANSDIDPQHRVSTQVQNELRFEPRHLEPVLMWCALPSTMSSSRVASTRFDDTVDFPEIGQSLLLEADGVPSGITLRLHVRYYPEGVPHIQRHRTTWVAGVTDAPSRRRLPAYT